MRSCKLWRKCLTILLPTLAVIASLISTTTEAQQPWFYNYSPNSVTCTTVPTLVASSKQRNAITIYNPATSTTVYTGGSTSLTTSNGFPVAATTVQTLNPYSGAVYCIVASGSQVINFWETY